MGYWWTGSHHAGGLEVVLDKEENSISMRHQEELLSKYPRPDLDGMLPFHRVMAVVNPGTLGVSPSTDLIP
jgi:hypothetical protein